jgi:hypothetical protein
MQADKEAVERMMQIIDELDTDDQSAWKCTTPGAGTRWI